MGGRTRWLPGVVGAGAVVLTVAGTLVVGVAPAGAGVYSSVAGTRSFQVQLRGNGHGHGLSQYGAQGAALQGLGYRKILRFYYPHTRVQTLDPSTIRVLISEAGDATTVAAQRGLHVSGVDGALSTRGITRYQLTASRGAHIKLLALRRGTWRTVHKGLPATSAFRRRGTVRVFLTDGTSTAYHGRVLAVRRTAHGATGVLTINKVSIDNYVAGVVPREMPASWRPAAVRAQAVAARSYARYEADHASSSTYDICDTSSCQVYGGATHYASDGSVLWTDDQDAVAGNENTYVTYQGAAIFAQFSASDGGWTTDGGQPYLVAQQDPYDTSTSGDPWASYQETIRSANLAGYYGLAKITGIDILRRDGNGTWGGRVTVAKITGTDSAGNTKTVRTDGFNLQWALGVGTTWLRLAPTRQPTGALQAVRRDGSGLRVTGWAMDADHASHSPKMRIKLDGRLVAKFRTHTRRPGIVRDYGLHYGKPGFRRFYRPGPGRHRACVIALDSNGLRPAHLGCATVKLPRH